MCTKYMTILRLGTDESVGTPKIEEPENCLHGSVRQTKAILI